MGAHQCFGLAKRSINCRNALALNQGTFTPALFSPPSRGWLTARGGQRGQPRGEVLRLTTRRPQQIAHESKDWERTVRSGRFGLEPADLRTDLALIVVLVAAVPWSAIWSTRSPRIS